MAKQTKSNKVVRNTRQRRVIKKGFGNKSSGVSLKSNPKFKKGPASNKVNVQDARQKIIQKKRTVTDARDVLATKAKTQDARSKLDRLRSMTNKQLSPTGSKVKVIGNNILQKVDRNGKISLVTNKNRNPSDMNVAIQKQLGLIAQPRSKIRSSPVKKTQVPVQRHSYPTTKNVVNERTLDEAAVLDYNSRMYKWINPELKPASHLIGSLDPMQALRLRQKMMQEEMLLANRSWPSFVPSRPVHLQPAGYADLDVMDIDEDMSMAPPPTSRISLRGSTRTSNIHSRLDTPPNQAFSHGILSQARTKVVVPAGHRVVISNLQQTVTEEDIKELFEEIGDLLSAKLVRPGLAEVIYKRLKDAQDAVDKYHNRQLDGQPMKCYLVNKTSGSQSGLTPLLKSDGILGRRSTGSEASGKLIPDLDTIHKVLFQRK